MQSRTSALNLRHLLLAVLTSVAVSSCTPVDSFGAYWDKGIVDPALEGMWKKTGLPGKDIHSIPGADTARFTRDGTSYLMQLANPTDPSARPEVRDRQQKDNDRRFAMRTLRIGNARLMMVRNPGGDGQGLLMRYEIQDTTLREYWMDGHRAVDYLAINHPDARNIHRTSAGSLVVIETLDAEVFQVLSEMLAAPEYWRLNCEYKKLPSETSRHE